MTFVIICNVVWVRFPLVTHDKAHIVCLHLALGFERENWHSGNTKTNELEGKEFS